ncbi:protein PAT1 homolog 1-like isoform X2 [Dermacentor silvarum]|uniref:protein PAT1 homolog 1-like isoform X2 n=1 Tax=Dermacentor silvarum TaxID=543639 RepID=UPI0018986086|nr:protein PAT1 homolog 1-like isoform X2 [Dermacentor silvarum]
MSKGFLAFRKESQGLHPLSHEDELLTAEVEDDYDALNDETFGGGLDDGWEEVHEKFAELEDRARHPLDSSSVVDSLVDEDPLSLNQDVVEQSISHLGLEDDRDDDPAIKSYSKSTTSPWPIEWGRPCSSPPPPAILQQFGGSPKTETIWTPKAGYPPADDRLSSLIWKLQQQSSTQVLPQAVPGKSSLPPNVHMLEELERDMLYSGGSHPVSIGSPPGESPWGAVHPEHEAGSPYSGVATSPGKRGSSEHSTGVLPAFNTQPKPAQFRFSPGRPLYPPPSVQAGAVPLPTQLGMSPPARTPGLVHGRMSPGIHSAGFGSRLPMPPVPHPMLGRGRVMMGPPPSVLLNNAMQSQMPLQGNLPFRPGFTMDLRRLLYPRQVQHPLLNKNHFASLPGNAHYQRHAYQTVFGQGSLPYDSPRQPSHHSYLQPQLHGNLDHRDNSNSFSGEQSDDPYAGLMTQKEKDWLVKIQLLQVQPENPDVDDYYYVMFTKKKAEQQELPGVDGGDVDKLKFIRPERVRTESKSYTPIQFERSLGKLQVVSVNYPRKILDMGVQRLSEDEDRKVPPDRHLLWFRQLLLDIEKLYSAVLEFEDSSCSAERRAEIAEKLFSEVQPSEERFVQMVGVRKGRSLVLRVLPKLKAEHQVATLAALLRHLSWLQRKDRHDGTLERGLLSAMVVIEHATLNDLIQLAASLLMNPDAAFPSTFALRVAWAIVVRAEHHFQCEETSQSFFNEVHKKWAKLLSEMVDLLIASLKKHDIGEDDASVESKYDSAVLLLFPHERQALASQLRRFAINSQLASELSCTSAAKPTHQAEIQLHHEQNGFGDKAALPCCGEPVTAVD